MALTKTKKSVIDVSSIMGGSEGNIQFKNGTDLNGTNDLTWDSTNNRLSVVSIEQDGLVGSAYSGHKNKIMNGCMRLAQRGEITGTTDLAYNNQTAPLGSTIMNGTAIGTLSTWTMENPSNRSLIPQSTSLPLTPNSLLTYALFDRWKMTIPTGQDNSGVGEHYTMSREEFSYDQSDVPGNPKYFMRINWSMYQNYATFEPYLSQHIENLLDMLGKTVTVSFYIKTDTPNLDITLSMFTRYNSSTAEDGTTLTTSDSISVSATWHKVEVTMDVPAAKSGQSTDSSESCEFRINFAGTATGYANRNVDIARMQVEEGNIATDFEDVPFDDLVNQCRRYYEKTYNLNTPPGSVTFQGLKSLHTGRGVWNNLNTTYMVEKRVVPTLKRWGACGRPDEHTSMYYYKPDTNTYVVTEYEGTTVTISSYWLQQYEPWTGGPTGWTGEFDSTANWWWSLPGWNRSYYWSTGNSNEWYPRYDTKGYSFVQRHSDRHEISQHYAADADYY